MENEISKLIAKYVEQLSVERGQEIKVNFCLSGQFVAKKGEDFEQVVSFAVPYDKILAVALSKLNGVTVESIVNEALNTDLDDSIIKNEALAALAKIKGKSSRKMSGKVTIKSSVLEIKEIDSCKYC